MPASNEIDAVLQRYVAQLCDLTTKKKAAAIHGSVRKVVGALNTLNKQYRSMIETTEREELCSFINAAVRATGLEVAAGVDLTEPWREW